MKSFMVWVTILTPQVADVIAARLLTKRYAVEALAPSGALVTGSDDYASHVLALQLSSNDANIDTKRVRDDVTSIFEAEGFKFHSVIVVDWRATASWSCGNLKISEVRNAKPTLAVVTPLPRGPYRKDDGIIDDTKPPTDEGQPS